MSTGIFPVAILAGGLATRLQPVTETIPKALVDVNGEPFIAHQLRMLRAHGVDRVVVCAGFLGEMIRDVVGNGTGYGLQVEFAFDGPRLLGTAGAVKQALPLLGEAFFVLYGDTYLSCDYRAVQTAFERSRRPALMTVFRNENRWDRSNVEFVNGRILAYDKGKQTPRMQHIDYGLGVFNHSAFEIVPRNQPYDLAMLYHSLLTQGQLAAYEVDQRFYEIGTFEGLEETRRHLAGRGDRGARTP